MTTALLAVALSAFSGGMLVYQLFRSLNEAALLTVAMSVVAFATIVQTSRGGRVGLVAAPAFSAAPLSVIITVAIFIEGDPFGIIAAVVITFLALLVAASAWFLTLAATRRRRSGWFDPSPPLPRPSSHQR